MQPSRWEALSWRTWAPTIIHFCSREPWPHAAFPSKLSTPQFHPQTLQSLSHTKPLPMAHNHGTLTDTQHPKYLRTVSQISQENFHSQPKHGRGTEQNLSGSKTSLSVFENQEIADVKKGSGDFLFFQNEFLNICTKGHKYPGDGAPDGFSPT